MDAQLASWRTIHERIASGAVVADGRPLDIAPSEREVHEVIVPLLEMIASRPAQGVRGLVGLAGPPGVGKTTFLAWLRIMAHLRGAPRIAFLSMDGYHLPNSILDNRTQITSRGEFIPMRQLKGLPTTYDVHALLADLRGLRSRRVTTHLPAYSRELHDPVAGAAVIKKDAEWVVVEGNHLFLDEPPWSNIRDLFDLRISLSATADLLRTRLAQRHSRAGRSDDWIAAHYARVDGPNIERVLPSLEGADVNLAYAGGGWQECS
jgi:pantothenate kinase